MLSETSAHAFDEEGHGACGVRHRRTVEALQTRTSYELPFRRRPDPWGPEPLPRRSTKLRIFGIESGRGSIKRAPEDGFEGEVPGKRRLPMIAERRPAIRARTLPFPEISRWVARMDIGWTKWRWWSWAGDRDGDGRVEEPSACADIATMESIHAGSSSAEAGSRPAGRSPAREGSRR